ncbi:MAG: acetyl-CoA carboxylase carboxyltransferase subunit alpha [Rhodospirillales bacterium]|nr:acetyl-CoA carboxylase carboxyltransferase subunit alpha [Rhodospirillales bacterium]
MRTFLDFEKPIADLEGKIAELRHLSSTGEINIAEEISRLQVKLDASLKQVYGKLSAWQKVQVARHFDRPHSRDYLTGLIDDFVALAGDKAFAEDPAMIGGIGRFRGRTVIVIGQEKGADTEDRIRHNFGMARPEGYRKAQRLMRLADRFALPVITLVDTPGAYPGVDAEARGQAEAIARSIDICLGLGVPIVSVVIGEGGSGGAIALAAADRVMMLEHAVYSVISPEGCASILWRDGEQAKTAAQAMKMTAEDLKELGIIDRIVAEPLGGAHRAPELAVAAVGDALAEALDELAGRDADSLRQERRMKFLRMGAQQGA